MRDQAGCTHNLKTLALAASFLSRERCYGGSQVLASLGSVFAGSDSSSLHAEADTGPGLAHRSNGPSGRGLVPGGTHTYCTTLMTVTSFTCRVHNTPVGQKLRRAVGQKLRRANRRAGRTGHSSHVCSRLAVSLASFVSSRRELPRSINQSQTDREQREAD